MKIKGKGSMNAEEYIEEWTFDAAELVDADGIGAAVVKRSNALKAVKMAEEETEDRIRTKAIRAFQEVMNGRLIICGVDYIDPILKQFIEKMNENDADTD